MNIEDISKFYNINGNEGMLLTYQGPFLQEMIEDISSIMNRKLSDASNLKINGKYLSLFIEQTQNILRYSSDAYVDKNGTPHRSGIILTGLKKNNVFIISGNPIEGKYESFLKEKMDKLKNCSREELKIMFKEQLRNNRENTYSSGAGLGLIEINRKSDNLEYNFSRMESGEVFFSIKTEYKI